MFDIIASVEEPEMHAKIQQRSHAGRFGADLESDEFASFCFGQDNSRDPWSAFSIQIITKRGNLFIACPFVPSKLQVVLFIKPTRP
jgi:hypothetical protein